MTTEERVDLIEYLVKQIDYDAFTSDSWKGYQRS